MADEQDSQAEKKDDRLNDYLSELIRMQDKKLPGAQDLQQLMHKHQLNEDDLEKLQMLIQRHLERAHEYKRTERWDNAIVETERALLFSPLDNELRLDLAELFLNRSIQYGYLQKDLTRSENEVKDALILEPDHRGAKKFQKELKQLHVMLQGRQYNKKIIPVVILAILVLGIALYPQIRQRFQFLTLDEENSGETAIQEESPPWTEKTLSVQMQNELSEDFELVIADSSISRPAEDGISSLSIAGYLEPMKRDYAVLNLEILHGQSNEAIGTLDIVSPGDAPLMQGETGRFFSHIYLNQDPENMNDLFVLIKESQIFEDPQSNEWESLDLFTENPMPQGVLLKLQNRFIQMIEGYDKNYLFYDLMIESKGLDALSILDLEVQLNSPDDQTWDSQDLKFVEHEIIPLKGQSIETTRVMFDLPKDFTREKGSLSVLLKNIEKNNEDINP